MTPYLYGAQPSYENIPYVRTFVLYAWFDSELIEQFENIEHSKGRGSSPHHDGQQSHTVPAQAGQRLHGRGQDHAMTSEKKIRHTDKTNV